MARRGCSALDRAGQLDVDGHHARAGAPPAGDAESPQDVEHRAVVGETRGSKAGDALFLGAGGEPAQDLARHAPPLPVVHNGNRDFGRVRLLLETHVSGDTYQLVARNLGDERLVIVVVDVGEVLDEPRAQPVHRREEAAVSRFG